MAEENVTSRGDIEFSLQEWNRDLVLRFPWNPVLFATFLTIGVCGNGTVVFIYSLRMKKKMEERFFIPILACMDFVACVFLCSFAILQSLQPVTTSSVSLCKSMMYLQHATSACSLFMLLAIAFQRYKMVCRPFGRQMSQSMKYGAIGLAVSLGYLLFIPHLFLSNIVTVESSSHGLQGQRCTTTAYDKTEKTLQISYRLTVFCIFLLTIIIMSLLYSLIARTVIHRMRVMKNPLSPKAITDRSARTISFTGQAALKQGGKDVFTFDSLRRKKRHFVTNRYSYMFMTITAMAVISYIVPIILAMSTGSSGGDVEKSLRYFIFKRLYVLSHIVNPFIYGAFDHTFREHMRSLLVPCGTPTGRRESRSTVNSVHSSD